MERLESGYVLLTGASGAIGKEIARGLLREGHSLILACRDEEKAQRLIDLLKGEFPKCNLRFLQLDLADEKSVFAAADVVRDVKLSGLINNAGVMNRHYRKLKSGIESTVAVNYLYTVLFTELVLPSLQRKSAIVFTTSLTRFLWRKDETKFRGRLLGNNLDNLSKNYVPQITEKEFSQLGTYGLSKRLVTDYAGWLSARVAAREIRVNCADPGVVNTGMITMDRWYDRLADIFFRPFIRSPRQGAIPALRAFAAKDSGKIFTRYRKRNK